MKDLGPRTPLGFTFQDSIKFSFSASRSHIRTRLAEENLIRVRKGIQVFLSSSPSHVEPRFHYLIWVHHVIEDESENKTWILNPRKLLWVLHTRILLENPVCGEDDP